MMLLTSTDTPLFRASADKHPKHVGWFLTPRKRGIPSTLTDTTAAWAADNNCFSGDIKLAKLLRWLRRLLPWRARCLFVPAPDVLANWTETLERFFDTWHHIAALGYPTAIVLQDGATIDTVPWHHINAVFLGGFTNWKLSQHALDLLDEARRRKKWRHVGRVNSQKRIKHFWHHANSFDGSFTHKEPDTAHNRLVPYILSLAHQKQMRI